MTKIENLPAVILVRPQMGENIGAAARAMGNFGLTDLRLVAPRDGWPNERAVDMASGAFEHMPAPRLYDDLGSALTDCHFAYATTARRRDMEKPSSDVRRACENAMMRIDQKQKVALVFGPERTGLENDDISLCDHLIHIPTNPDFSSLNLGQAVLLVLYEWSMQSNSEFQIPEHAHIPATHEEFENMMARLETELTTNNFFKSPEMRPTMMNNIRTMLLRAGFTDQETNTFHGIISALRGNKIKD